MVYMSMRYFEYSGNDGSFARGTHGMRTFEGLTRAFPRPHILAKYVDISSEDGQNSTAETLSRCKDAQTPVP